MVCPLILSLQHSVASPDNSEEKSSVLGNWACRPQYLSYSCAAAWSTISAGVPVKPLYHDSSLARTARNACTSGAPRMPVTAFRSSAWHRHMSGECAFLRPRHLFMALSQRIPHVYCIMSLMRGTADQHCAVWKKSYGTKRNAAYTMWGTPWTCLGSQQHLLLSSRESPSLLNGQMRSPAGHPHAGEEPALTLSLSSV